jgi:hypothetical protein
VRSVFCFAHFTKNRHAPLTRIHPAQWHAPKFNGVPEAAKNPKGMGGFNE